MFQTNQAIKNERQFQFDRMEEGLFWEKKILSTRNCTEKRAFTGSLKSIIDSKL